MNATLAAMTDFLIIGAIMAVILVLGGVAWRLEQRRLRQLAEALSGAGLEAWTSPTDDQKRRSFERLGPFRDLRTGAQGVVWCAIGVVDGKEVALVEHRYTSGSGKNRTTHRHTVAAIGAPEVWPALALADENLFHKIAELFGSRDLRLEDERFNKRWRVTTDHEEFGTLVLSPEVQTWSLLLERGTLVRIGRGGVCLALSKGADAPTALALARRVRELAGLIPPELDAWSAATPAG